MKHVFRRAASSARAGLGQILSVVCRETLGNRWRCQEGFEEVDMELCIKLTVGDVVVMQGQIREIAKVLDLLASASFLIY